ncbi:uncharacterized protein LOC107270857 [Cephus cinctus]|uniref:Uncharacterized protein LOC107270857 n=1 Tax=Cephus cinctus TaxID=211228 RepID=A0AAJ7C4P1_CEPCN|nr:uncharacterized protein LOC107270857 [Cephus cinctus]
METRFFCLTILLSISVQSLSAVESETSEIESITGTREPEDLTTTPSPILVTTVQSFRQSRWYRYGYHGRQDDVMKPNGYHDDHEVDDDHDDHVDVHDDHHDEDMKALAATNDDYWGGYYDFLINEGSYKFWAVFQLATAALLIYSGFAALYYAKVNPPTDDYEDYLLRRRRSINRPSLERTFLGLRPETFQLIVDAIAKEFH